MAGEFPQWIAAVRSALDLAVKAGGIYGRTPTQHQHLLLIAQAINPHEHRDWTRDVQRSWRYGVCDAANCEVRTASPTVRLCASHSGPTEPGMPTPIRPPADPSLGRCAVCHTHIDRGDLCDTCDTNDWHRTGRPR